MKKQIIFLMLTLFSMSSYAQKIEWLNGASHNLNGECVAGGIAVDSKGNIYTVGKTLRNVKFNIEKDELEYSTIGKSDAFILKQDAKGKIKWLKTFSGKKWADAHAISIDANDNMYISGIFSGKVDFDPGDGVHEMTGEGDYSTFTVKLNASGNFVWVNSLEGTTYKGVSMNIDIDGNVHLMGVFTGTADFDPGDKVYSLSVEAKAGKKSFMGPTNVFIAKYTSSGNFIWAKKFKQENDKIMCNQMLVDSKKNIYITGGFYGTVDLNPNDGVHQVTASKNLGHGTYIVKLDSSGDFLWAKDYDLNLDFQIATDKADNLYISGAFYDKVDLDPNGKKYIITAPKKDYSLFIFKLDEGGNFEWAKHNLAKLSNITGELFSFMSAISSMVIDDNENIYACGGFNGKLQLDLTDESKTIENRGNSINTFIFKMDTKGNMKWARKMVSKNNNSGGSLAFDGKGNLYVVGDFVVGMHDEEEVFNISVKFSSNMFTMKIKDTK